MGRAAGPPARFDALADSDVHGFVAALWRRAGWSVDAAGGPEEMALATRESNGRPKRTVLYAFPPSEGRVSASALRSVVERPEPADSVTAVSLVGFTPGALDVADAHGVDVVGPDAVSRLVDAHDAEDLLDA